MRGDRGREDVKEPEEGQCHEGIGPEGTHHRTQVDKDRTARGHGSLVASARTEAEEEKGGLSMSYMSQKPAWKARGKDGI